MPYLSKDAKLAGTKYDARVKLMPEDKKEVINLYKTTDISINGIARWFGVSKRLIQFILFPERLIQANKNRDWRKYYTKEKRKNCMRKHRKRKQELFIKGKIK